MKKKKDTSRVIKEGTVVTLHSSCNYVGCRTEEEYTLGEDMTENDLTDLAFQNAQEIVQVEGWFTLTDEEKE